MNWWELLKYAAGGYTVCVLVRAVTLFVQWHFLDVPEEETEAERDLSDRMAVGSEEWLP